MKTTLLYFYFFLIITNFLFSQNVGINASGSQPHASAILDLDATDKGFLMPRMTTIQRNAIANPAVGLQIYNTTTNCVDVYFGLNMGGGIWKALQCGCNSYPDATFTIVNPTPEAGDTIQFVPNYSSNNFTYNWTFDQANIPTNVNSNSLSYWMNAGTYDITLVVTDSVGCSTTNLVPIVINCTNYAGGNTPYSFTNCSQTGRTGPSQAQCNSAYTSTNLNGLVTVSSGIQSWTVPHTGNYLVEAAGAEAANPSSFSPGGKGALIQAELSLNQGDILKILVGQQGSWSSNQGSGGGGGSFVVSNSNVPLIIAGGGGGGGELSNGPGSGGNGRTQTSGGNGSGGTGGTNGNAGSGGDYYASGSGFSTSVTGETGTSFLSGGLGSNCYGNQSSCGVYGVGGFGSGGAGAHNGGGGGGYSGGGGGSTWSWAGGGGSYVTSTATNISTSNGQYEGSASFSGNLVTNLNSYNSGHGYVNITPLGSSYGPINGINRVCQGTTGSNFSIPAIPDAQNYTWSVDNGATIASGQGTQNIMVDFPNSNTAVTISVIATNSCSQQSAPITHTVTVFNPLATFTPSQGAVNASIQFTATNYANATYSWTFDQGTPNTASVYNPTSSWSTAGTYDVSLTVDSAGCQSTNMQQINIINCTPASYSFTNCSQTGRTGPSQAQCNSAYTSTNLDGLVTVSSGIQSWTVPHTGNYLVEAAGAEAANPSSFSPGGKGALIQGKLSFNQGDILKILVGQQGSWSSNQGSGGGGGSFVVSNSNVPLIIAGGGGGGGELSNGPGVGGNGRTHTSGGNGSGGTGGTNGNAGSGGNYYASGSGFSTSVTGEVGTAFLSGGLGSNCYGNQSSCGLYGVGGFGSGGAGAHNGGGGGGYSGGGGGSTWSWAGGGGSYVTSTATNISTSNGQYEGSASFNGNQVTNLGSYNAGHGYVSITHTCQ